MKINIDTNKKIRQIQGTLKTDLSRWALKVQGTAVQRAPKETMTLIDSWKMWPVRRASGLISIEFGFTAQHAAAQHDRKLRHLPNFRSETPKFKMAKIGRQRHRDYFIKHPTSFKDLSLRHSNLYNMGYKKAVEDGLLDSPKKNPYLDVAVRVHRKELNKIIKDSVIRALK